MRVMQSHAVERRVHTVFVTRNTEYHVRGSLCVAVRQRDDARWESEHPAVGRSLAGALRWLRDGLMPHSERPSPGDAIYFRNGDRDLITSKLIRIDRPSRAVVESYPSLS